MINVFTLTQPVRDRAWQGYLIGVAAVALSLAVRFALGDIALKFPFVIFLPPVVLTTFVGGLRPGIASAFLAGVAADATLIAPPGKVVPVWPDGWIAMAFYVLTVGIDIALIHGLTTAFRRAAIAEAALRSVNEGLETRVVERTTELHQTVAEKEAAEAQIRQMQKMESVGQLTGGIAHDFNNMLAVVIGSLEMARRRLDDHERATSFIESAEEGAKRASQLVARLLAFSRQQPLEPRALDANQLVGGMSELLRRTIGEQIMVETVLAGGLWRCFADAMQVENAILNLAVNARDAMPTGGRLTIETANVDLDRRYVRSHPDATPGPYVMISVADTGTGMSQEVIERAFDPFYTTKGVGKGTGLGLSQVYGFVTQSGGHIAIASQIGRGTTIRIYLPRHAGRADEAGASDSIANVPMAQAQEIVLVVEDEPNVRHMSVDALRELGYTVVQASDAKQALSVLAIQPRIDLLFTDVIMPEMNGRQLADAARALRPALGIVYTTGYARDAVLQEGTPDPTIAILPKPFTLSQLAIKVRDVLNRSRAS